MQAEQTIFPSTSNSPLVAANSMEFSNSPLDSTLSQDTTELSTTSSDCDIAEKVDAEKSEKNPPSNGNDTVLPRFTSNLIDNNVMVAPTARLPSTPTPSPVAEFATPTHNVKKHSRPNSPSNAGRPVPLRGRIANIRRESDCSLESEVAHEKLVKTSQQVSIGFEEFSLNEKSEERKRAMSLTEPISIFTNAFLPHCSSPSPTRNVDTQKQCYSPSARQVVRSNIPYSPSPSPTPGSPTRNRIMRSMSPIAVRQISNKRRYAASNGFDSDNDVPSPSSQYSIPAKRSCSGIIRNAASPLVRDFPNPFVLIENFNNNERTSSPISESSSSSSLVLRPQRLLVDPILTNRSFGLNLSVDSDGTIDDEILDVPTSVHDNSSTAFSSRAGSPSEEQIPDPVCDADISISSNLNTSPCSSRCSSVKNDINSSSNHGSITELTQFNVPLSPAFSTASPSSIIAQIDSLPNGNNL
uniref:Uncharacterized protein n=1 Tax=Acrobeloides nanus TaxID=290746 RepID=A0A914CI22_9BILA